MLAAGVPCVRADVGQADVFLTEPFVRENGFITEVRRSGIGRMQRWGPFWRFSETPALAEAAHLFGEDTPALLAELGFSQEEIQDWKQRRIIAWEEPVTV
jgi:crotonobetainyl-CoA:carnitine CoA-transferase CaiB-like acyl-CoA transferase